MGQASSSAEWKISLIGFSPSGKTSVLFRYAKGLVVETIPTLGVISEEKTAVVDGVRCKLMISGLFC